SSVNPAPGPVSNLTQISVTFDQPVDGVDAADLLVSGVSASSLSGSNAVYTFAFAQPREGTVRISWTPNHGISNRLSPATAFDATAAGATWQYTFADTVPPIVTAIDPVPNATLTSLTKIKVWFSEPVGAINASDLLINGVAAKDPPALALGRTHLN